MRKTIKKFVALTMVGVLAVTPLTAFAATGTTEEATSPATGSATGAGELEGFLTDDDMIFSVTLPTDDPDSPTFKFTMDPQNLLNKTDSTNYATTDTVLFSTKTKTSNELSITNNSQFDVDVSLTATITGLTGDGYAIDLAEDATFKDTDNNTLTNTSLYLGLIYETATANSVPAVSSTTKALVADDTGLTAKVTLGGMPDNYTIGKDDQSNYVYKKIESPATATGVAKFKMEGACNPNADWSTIDDLETPAAPTVKVVWKVEKHMDTPPTPESDGSTAIVISYTGDADPAAGSLSFNTPKGTVWTPAASAYPSKLTIDATNNTLTISTEVVNTLKTGATYGTGTYTCTINGTQYSFIVK